MSETTPNANGPAKRPMPPEQMASLGLTPTPIPADQAKPEHIGTLSIEYRNCRPVITVSGGTYVPQNLPVLNEAGNPAAVYAAGPIPQPQTRSAGDHTLVYEPYFGVFDTSYASAWTLGRTIALADPDYQAGRSA
ncbi:hypothetical protein [Streptomyces sp. NPDC059970]|uniref:hypothetical protein n=1 Tax=Streptomyces sp. NPDC059970 TaxID=3347019 RepID=UPI003681A7EA